jgi:hypothetical protein
MKLYSKKKLFAFINVDYLSVRDAPNSKDSYVLAKLRQNSCWELNGNKTEKTEKSLFRIRNIMNPGTK